MKEFLVKYKFEQLLSTDEYSYSNVDVLYGKIYLLDDDNYENQTKIGEIQLDLHIWNPNFNFFTSFDRSRNTVEIGFLLLDSDTGEYLPEIEDLFRENENPNILVIKEVTLFEEHRNKGYGKLILEKIEQIYYGKAGIVVFKSFPRQHDISIKDSPIFSKYKLNSLEKDIKVAQDKLNKFYEDCGYQKIPNVENFYFKELL